MHMSAWRDLALAAARADGSVEFWDRVSGWTVLLALGVAVMAVVLSLVLGPLGRPQARTSRTGGLTRALSRADTAAGPLAPLDPHDGGTSNP